MPNPSLNRKHPEPGTKVPGLPPAPQTTIPSITPQESTSPASPQIHHSRQQPHAKQSRDRQGAVPLSAAQRNRFLTLDIAARGEGQASAALIGPTTLHAYSWRIRAHAPA